MSSTIIVNTPEKYTYSVPTLSPGQVFIGIPKIKRAFDAVCASFGISPDRLKTDHSRKRDVCMCRHAVWKIVRDDDPHISLKTLGEYFGKFDHTTVIHGIGSISNAMLTDEVLVKKYTTAVGIFSCSEEYKEDINYYTDYTDKTEQPDGVH